MRNLFPDFVCHFCGHVIPEMHDEEVFIAAEWACQATGLVDLDSLGNLEHVCLACAERLVGPDWREKGREAIAENDAWRAVRCKESDYRVLH